MGEELMGQNLASQDLLAMGVNLAYSPGEEEETADQTWRDAVWDKTQQEDKLGQMLQPCDEPCWDS